MKVTVDFPSVASEKQSGYLTSFNYFWQQFKEMKQNLISQTQRRALNSLTPPLDLNSNAVIIHYGDHCLRKAFNISTSFLLIFAITYIQCLGTDNKWHCGNTTWWWSESFRIQNLPPQKKTVLIGGRRYKPQHFLPLWWKQRK